MVLILRFTVALLATLFFCGISLHAWRQRSFGVACLALWMGALAASTWLLVLAIFPNGRLTPIGMLVTGLLTTLSGPLLLGYVLYALRGMRLHWAWFLPFVIQVMAAVALGKQSNLYFSAIPVMLLEFAYACVAWLVWYRYARPRSSQPAVIGVLIAVTALHLANVASIVDYLGFIDYRPIRQFSLVIVVVWLMAALILSLAHSPMFRNLVPGLAAPVSDADQALFGRIEELMRNERPWADPDLDVGAMARALGTYPNAVSRALSRAGGISFYDYVNRYRVREAERLLSDPEESRIKIEALGRQAGFRARSTFFKLFRQHTGQTPSEYRAARSTPAERVQSSPSAH
jgi:AraC-like DNA-binding protein